MRIAGVYWYDTMLDPKIQHAVSEPYGLQRILAIAKKYGHEVELFIPLEKFGNQIKPIDEEKIKQNLEKFRPDIVCFSIYTCQYPASVRIANHIKRFNPDTIVIAGNRYPSSFAEEIDPCFDFTIINEGEASFDELLQEITGGQRYDQIRGIAYRRGQRTIITQPRKRIKDIDAYPLALRFPIVLDQTYKGISIPTLSEKPHYAHAEFSRGCFGVCKFCDNKQVWKTTVIHRSVKVAVDELEQLKSQGVDIVYMIDLNFTALPHKVEEFCNEILRRNLKISWYCMSNIETARGRTELLRLMKKAGCYKIAWGIESTDDTSLKNMDKRISGHLLKNNIAKEVLQDALDVGMLNQGYYIIGFPWETEESITSAGKDLKNLPLHQLNVGIFTPIPSSDFYVSNLDPNLEKHDRNTLIYKHNTLDHMTLKKLQEKLHHNFYSSQEYLENVKASINIDPRFKQAFKEYFAYIGKEVNLDENSGYHRSISWDRKSDSKGVC